MTSIGSSIRAALGGSQPPPPVDVEDEDDAETAEAKAVLAAAVAAKAERARKRAAVKAHNAEVKAEKKRRRTPAFVRSTRHLPLFAEIKPEHWSVNYPDQLDDALANLDHVLRTGQEDVWSVDRGVRHGITGATKARAAVTLPEARLAALAKVGIELVLAPTGDVVERTPGATMDPAATAQVKRAVGPVRGYLWSLASADERAAMVRREAEIEQAVRDGRGLLCAWCLAPAEDTLGPDDKVGACGRAPDCAEPVARAEPAA